MKKLVLDRFTTNIFTASILLYIALIIFQISIASTLIKYVITIIIITIFSLQIYKNKMDIKINFVFIPYILFFSLYFLRTSDLDGIMIVINQITFYLYTLMLYRLYWKEEHIKKLSSIFLLSFPLFLIGIMFPTKVVNENTLASLILYTSCFILLYKLSYKSTGKYNFSSFFYALITSIILLMTGSRSTFLSFSFGVLTYILWDILAKRKILGKIYFFAISYIVYFITIVYPKINEYSFYPVLNDLSMRFFQKPLLTGRDSIWRNTFKFIKDGPFWGYGSSISPEDLYDTTLSSHNLYLQTSIQVGITGVLLLAIFFFCIWNLSLNENNNKKIRLLSSYIIVIIIHQTFEVTFTQNQFSVALLQWSIVGILVSELSIYNKNTLADKTLSNNR